MNKKFYLLLFIAVLIVSDFSWADSVAFEKRTVKKMDKSLIKTYVYGIWNRIGKKDVQFGKHKLDLDSTSNRKYKLKFSYFFFKLNALEFIFKNTINHKNIII